jgi:hypothetical protein
MLKPEKTAAEKWGELGGLLVTAAIVSAVNGWLLSTCAAFFFPSFYLAFWQWWLVAITFRSFIGNGSND